jgi:hypothetical protein
MGSLDSREDSDSMGASESGGGPDAMGGSDSMTSLVSVWVLDSGEAQRI